MQQGIMYRVDNLTVTEQRELTEYLPDSIHTLSHRYYEEQYSATIESLQSLTYVVTFVMIIVLCIALGNLTSILYGNRMDELKILHSIGITKEKIVHKLWLENSLVCIGGYLTGIVVTILLVWSYNKVSLLPQGKILELISLQGLATACTMPLFILLFCVLPGIMNTMKKGNLLVG